MKHRAQPHWLHPQRGPQLLRPTLQPSELIMHLHWLRTWLGTCSGTRCHCQTWNSISMNLKNLINFPLIRALMLNSHLRRRCWIAITVEKWILRICVWRESVLWMENWGEDHALEVSQRLPRPEQVLWR